VKKLRTFDKLVSTYSKVYTETHFKEDQSSLQRDFSENLEEFIILFALLLLSVMAEPCQNPKCDYYGTTGCFARMCKERCRDTRCVMFGQDHFAKICCYRCDNRECIKFGQYHPPGEICSNSNTFYGGQPYSSQPLSFEHAQMAIDAFRQMLPNVQQQHAMFGNDFMLGQLPASQQEPPQTNQFSFNQQQSFDPFASLSFPSSTTSNHMPRSPFNGGWPFGQN
jgi:hypothetical protein